MKVLVVATVDAEGRPRTSAVDGHFVHGRWVFTTSYIRIVPRWSVADAFDVAAL